MSEQNKQQESIVTITIKNGSLEVKGTTTPRLLGQIAITLLRLTKEVGGNKMYKEALESLSSDCDCKSCKERRLLEKQSKTPANPNLN
jgi:uncharacterized Fe-S center protein